MREPHISRSHGRLATPRPGALSSVVRERSATAVRQVSSPTRCTRSCAMPKGLVRRSLAPVSSAASPWRSPARALRARSPAHGSRCAASRQSRDRHCRASQGERGLSPNCLEQRPKSRSPPIFRSFGVRHGRGTAQCRRPRTRTNRRCDSAPKLDRTDSSTSKGFCCP